MHSSSKPEKPVVFLGTSRADLLSFPDAVIRRAGFQLSLVQGGKMPNRFDYLQSIGSGVIEIKLDGPGMTYRVIYVAKLNDTVYVLHAFNKKSTSGIATPTADIRKATERYKDLVQELRNSKR